MERRVAVTGLGAVSPVGNTLAQTWEALKAGVSGVGEITKFDTTDYKVKVAAEVKDFDPTPLLSAPEVRRNDLFTQYAIVAAHEAMVDSGLDVEESIDRERLGVYVGSGIGGINTMLANADKLIDGGPRKVSPFLIPSMIANMAAGQISIRNRALGPPLPVVTAAATTSHGVCGGLLLYLGFVGTTGQVKKLFEWAGGFDKSYIAFIVIIGTILLYALLEHWRKRWLAVPLGCVLAGFTAYLLGAPFSFQTAPGLPPMSPAYWWGENTGWMMGLPTMDSFLVVFPFAVLAVAMWSPDFLGHQVFQKISYPERSEKALMNIDDTMFTCSVRQVAGSILGGANFTSSWGTYIVPASIAKRPIPAGAILTALFCIIASVWGYPMDLAIWQPVLSVALIVGVYVPLLEAGMEMTRKGKTTQSAAIVVFSSALVNPVFGWSLTMLLDNLGLIGCKERSAELGFMGRVVVPTVGFVILCAAMGAVGMLPGIPAFLEQFRNLH